MNKISCLTFDKIYGDNSIIPRWGQDFATYHLSQYFTADLWGNKHLMGQLKCTPYKLLREVMRLAESGALALDSGRATLNAQAALAYICPRVIWTPEISALIRSADGMLYVKNMNRLFGMFTRDASEQAQAVLQSYTRLTKQLCWHPALGCVMNLNKESNLNFEMFFDNLITVSQYHKEKCNSIEFEDIWLYANNVYTYFAELKNQAFDYSLVFDIPERKKGAEFKLDKWTGGYVTDKVKSEAFEMLYAQKLKSYERFLVLNVDNGAREMVWVHNLEDQTLSLIYNSSSLSSDKARGYLLSLIGNHVAKDIIRWNVDNTLNINIDTNKDGFSDLEAMVKTFKLRKTDRRIPRKKS